jgi:hypothetical protein
VSTLDRVIEQAESEIGDAPRLKSARAPKRSMAVFSKVVVGLLLVCLYLTFNELSSWVFGVPDETVQADIIELLEFADDKLQRDYGVMGRYPLQLPADAPTTLVGFKRTLAGYKLDAQIVDLHIELERDGQSVQTRRIE